MSRARGQTERRTPADEDLRTPPHSDQARRSSFRPSKLLPAARVTAPVDPSTTMTDARALGAVDVDAALRSLVENDERDFPELDIRARDDADPLIEEGPYDARAVRCSEEVFTYGKRKVAKFVMWLLILGPKHQGVILKFFAELPGGRRNVSQSAKYRRAWQAVARRKAPKGDRLSPRVFKNRLIHVLVGTSKKSGAPVNHYSVVTEIID